MKKNITLTILFVFGLIFKVSADSFSYNNSLEIQTEYENFIVIQFQNWTDNTWGSRFKMITNDQNSLTSVNNYSYIICFDKNI